MYRIGERKKVDHGTPENKVFKLTQNSERYQQTNKDSTKVLKT